MTLLAGLRAGETVEALAEALQRKPTAIQARCKKMLPPEYASVLRVDADSVLRDLLAADPGYDAEANLDLPTPRKWNTERDGTLALGWHTRRPLAELVKAVPASEIEIANRLMRLGLATDSVAVVERLGCEPGGALDLRCRMMRDRAAASVWVLVVDGLPTGRHISLHATRDEAHAHFTEITPETGPDAVPDAALAADSDAVDSLTGRARITATVAWRALGAPHGPVETL